MTTTKKHEARNEKGQLLCEACDGEGLVEVLQPARSSTQIDPEHAVERCTNCDGSGVERCVDCGEPAKVHGENGDQVYCDVGHAWADGNWPSCPVCQTRPQHAALAPFCGDNCDAAFRSRIELQLAPLQLADGRA